MLTSAQVAAKHRKIRDAAVAKKIQSVIAYLDKQDISQKLLEKLISIYIPKTTKITNILTKKVIADAEEKIRQEVKDIVKSETFKVSQERIAEEVSKQLRARLRALFDDEY